jgi:hypothetical protein
MGSRWLARVVAGAVGLTFALGAGSAAAARPIDVTASIGGHALARTSSGRPVPLAPTRSGVVDLRVANDSDTPLLIHNVLLQGKVAAFTFFDYEATVDLEVPPRSASSVRYSLDLTGLRGQATGLMAASVTLIDPDGHPVAAVPFVADVRGSARSVFGIFGIVVALLTAASYAGALLGVVRHTLPQNRWWRAMRFAVPGLGLGLAVVFTLSAARVFVPGERQSFTIVTLFTAGMFLAGYLTPTPVELVFAEPDEHIVPVEVAPPAPPADTTAELHPLVTYEEVGPVVRPTPAGMAPAQVGAVGERSALPAGSAPATSVVSAAPGGAVTSVVPAPGGAVTSAVPAPSPVPDATTELRGPSREDAGADPAAEQAVEQSVPPPASRDTVATRDLG